LHENGGVVNFTISNNKPIQKEKSMEGIGLKNLRERLSLIYPGHHEFTISETDTTFTITMQIRP
jgi:LytS/YehU family sensor histidine kinase